MLVGADVDKRKIRKVVRKACAQRTKISLLKDVKIRKQFEEIIIIIIIMVIFKCYFSGELIALSLYKKNTTTTV